MVQSSACMYYMSSDFQPKLKPYKCSTYSIQIISAAQEIHIGASLMFVAHSKPKI